MAELEIEEIKKKISELTEIKNELKNEEQAIKLTMNSIYGAVGNAFFVCFNTDVAEAVTLQGQDMIKFSEKIVNRYFQEHWHLDTELHEKLGLSRVKKIHKPLVIYSDTDSCDQASKIILKSGDNIEEIQFGDLFRLYSKAYDVNIDERGNEIIEPYGISALNYKDDVTFSGIKRIIRHKVSKPKWRIVTDSGKEVVVTNDHSITVFRDSKKIHIKPSEINIETDRILSIDLDI